LILNRYRTGDFIQGMIIIAIRSDKVYDITKGEVYEIDNVYKSSNDGIILISFIGNSGDRVNKNVDMEGHGFDKYFKIA